MAEAGGYLPEAGEPHADLAPVLFLLGRWEGAGVGGYPTIESFRFGQEISFSHNGKPYLSYVSRTWLLDADGAPGASICSRVARNPGRSRKVACHRRGDRG